MTSDTAQWPTPERLLVTAHAYSFHRRVVTEVPRGIVIGAGRILRFIDPDDRSQRAGIGRVPVVDLGGFTAIPGLIDAHNHQPSAARDVRAEKTAHCASLEQLLGCLAEAARRTPPGGWIVTEHSLTTSQLDMTRLPRAAELDAATTEHPVAVRFGAHVMALNTQGLHRSGLLSHLGDPRHGHIDRDPATGLPSGPVREYGALRHVQAAIPATTEPLTEALHSVQQDYARQGIPAVRVPGLRPGELTAYQRLRERHGTLATRVAGCARVDPNASHEEQLEFLRETDVRTGLGDDVLRVDALKIFVDGGIETTLTGRQHRFLTGRELDELVREAAAAGWSVACHAVSAEAVDLVLDAYESARTSGAGSTLAIEHGFFLTPAQIERAARLRVWYSTQLAAPSIDARCVTSSPYGQLAGCCPLASALRAGLRCALGSDWNAVPRTSQRPFGPLRSVAAAVTRRSEYGDDLGQPEAISLADAFYLHTAAPAALMGDQWLGGLFPGARADIALLQDDPVRCDIRLLPELAVKATVHAGDVMEH
jgi:predicted amidohydrolase YtcJ